MLVVPTILAGSNGVDAQSRVRHTLANLATGKESYMVRLTDNLPPASNGNDGNPSTIVRTTNRTVDAYWEVDLEQECAVYHVHVDAADGFGQRMTHATVRLFDGNHDSVYSEELDDFVPPVFHVDCGGPRCARYVRVGFEHKERSSPTGGIEWYLGLKEVTVLGRPASEVGLLSFEASANRVQAGQPVTLTWRAEDVRQMHLYPDVGSLDGLTDSSGAGSITVLADRSVEYVLVAEGTFGRDVHALSVRVDDEALPIYISELVARNEFSWEDGYGDHPDWVELHNPGQAAVDLAGYGLSDDVSRPMKWVFPEANVPAHGYLVVFASGRTAPIDPAGGIHTNWRLNGAGESVVLTTPNAVTVIDAIVDYPPLCDDLAYGRDMGGNLTFQEPTPGRINLATSYEGWLSPPVFSHERGFYDRPFELSLYHEDPDAEVWVSLDGGVPEVLYRDPIQVAGTAVVRASVTRPQFKSPRVQTHTYLDIDDVINSSVIDPGIARGRFYADRLRDGLLALPTMAIAVPALPDDYREREASVEVLWPDGSLPVQENCGMVRYGGAWTTFAKKNYRLKFRREYGAPKLKAPLFNGFDHGFPVQETFDELDLGGGSHDMNQRGFYMAARFVEDTMLDMGSLNPHGRFVHLYINGTYWGQFHLRERLVEHFLADYLGGEPEDYVHVRGNDNVGSSFTPGTPDPVNRDSWQRVRALAGSYQDVRAYLDVNSLIDFMLLWLYGNCESEYRATGPTEAGSGFKFWLADADGFLRTGALNQDRTSNVGPGGLFGALVAEKDPDFMTLLADRIYRHMSHGGALTPSGNTGRLLARMTEIQDSLIAECARWRYRTPSDWNAAAVEIVDHLFPLRTDQLLGYLRSRKLYPAFDPPEYNQHGGDIDDGFALLLSTDVGTIYYTLDGSDPRLPGGAVAPGAQVHGSSASGELLIPPGSSWRYWDKGTAPDGAWCEIGFDDTAWGSGPAQLGYGDGDEATVVSFGRDPGSKHITTYFRHSFTAINPADNNQVTLNLLRDDGAVIYLNGVELFRDNMPAGDVTADTTAAAGVSGADESQWFAFDVLPEKLVAGRNTLAVELHQIRGASSDISFDLSLETRRLWDHDPIVLHGDAIVKSRVLNGTQWSALNEAYFTMTEPAACLPNTIGLRRTRLAAPLRAERFNCHVPDAQLASAKATCESYGPEPVNLFFPYVSPLPVSSRPACSFSQRTEQVAVDP